MTTSDSVERQRLIKMANQIADNMPTRTAVAAQVGQHMRQFWTPEMRRALQQIARETPEVLSSEVHAAMTEAL